MSDHIVQALRHSKVKLTWDEDEPERTQVTRRALTRKEIEENDFRAYIASSSDSEEDAAGQMRIHLSTERWRAVEPYFTPNMAGVDAAGLGELASNVLSMFAPDVRARLVAAWHHQLRTQTPQFLP